MKYNSHYIDTENIKRLGNVNLYKKIILITSDKWDNFGIPHFVHTMEYFYFALDIIVNNLDSFIIITEPKLYYLSNYVSNFIDLLYSIQSNFILLEEYKGIVHEIHKFHHFCGIITTNNPNQYGLKLYDDFIFLESNIKKKDYYYLWFQNLQTSNILFNNTFGKLANIQGLRIGLVNRKLSSGRCIINEKELLNEIKIKFNTNLNVEYFEDKSFKDQINFFKDHNIIISPHGGQLVSIPFSPNNSLIIEYCHEEHHPYYYFPGLSYSSNKYHVMICDDHSVFPSWKSEKYKKINRQLKLNINCNIDKIIHVINIYINNNYNLPERKCYLY